jgi:riboflavin synthase
MLEDLVNILALSGGYALQWHTNLRGPSMFTGIIQAKAAILDISKQPGLWRFAMSFEPNLREGLRHGASVAHNGVCLTVAEMDQQAVYFDVMDETLKVTNLSDCHSGDLVNIERALSYGDEIGGHILSGHIHATATLIEREANQQNSRLRFECDPRWMSYILPKGFIALDGASLTLGLTGPNWFEVYLIPETRTLTTLDAKPQGSHYNIEIDSQTQAIVDTVERVLAAKKLAG